MLEEERKKLRSEKGAIKDREEMLRRRVEGLDKILMEVTIYKPIYKTFLIP